MHVVGRYASLFAATEVRASHGGPAGHVIRSEYCNRWAINECVRNALTVRVTSAHRSSSSCHHQRVSHSCSSRELFVALRQRQQQQRISGAKPSFVYLHDWYSWHHAVGLFSSPFPPCNVHRPPAAKTAQYHTTTATRCWLRNKRAVLELGLYSVLLRYILDSRFAVDKWCVSKYDHICSLSLTHCALFWVEVSYKAYMRGQNEWMNEDFILVNQGP